MIETKASRAKWQREHEAAKEQLKANVFGRPAVNKMVVHKEPNGGSQHGKHKNTEERKAYRREWMAKRRAAASVPTRQESFGAR